MVEPLLCKPCNIKFRFLFQLNEHQLQIFHKELPYGYRIIGSLKNPQSAAVTYWQGLQEIHNTNG